MVLLLFITHTVIQVGVNNVNYCLETEDLFFKKTFAQTLLLEISSTTADYHSQILQDKHNPFRLLIYVLPEFRNQFDSFEATAKQTSLAPEKCSDEAIEPCHNISAQDLFSSRVLILVTDRMLSAVDQQFTSYDNLNQSIGFFK